MEKIIKINIKPISNFATQQQPLPVTFFSSFFTVIIFLNKL